MNKLPAPFEPDIKTGNIEFSATISYVSNDVFVGKSFSKQNPLLFVE